MVGVVQLVRAPDCGSGGRGFEPHLPPWNGDFKGLRFLFFHPLLPSAKTHNLLRLFTQISEMHSHIWQKIYQNNILKIKYYHSISHIWLKKVLPVSKKFVLLHPLSREKTESNRRSGSSVWLEYMPVTHGVASSSLVRTAKQKKKFSSQRTFFSPQRH